MEFYKSNLKRKTSWIKKAKHNFWLKTKEYVKQNISGRLKGMNKDIPGKDDKKEAGFMILISDKVESRITRGS